MWKRIIVWSNRSKTLQTLTEANWQIVDNSLNYSVAHVVPAKTCMGKTLACKAKLSRHKPQLQYVLSSTIMCKGTIADGTLQSIKGR